jgi:hypothetical protein
MFGKNNNKNNKFNFWKFFFGIGFAYNILAFIAVMISIVLLVTTVSSYYYISHKDKELIATDNNAKVKDANLCTCTCGCKDDPSKCTCSSGGGGSSNNSGNLNTVGELKFTGDLNKDNLVNQIFFLNKDITATMGVPMWVPYAAVSVETGGSIYIESAMKIRQSSKALDSVTTGAYNGRKGTSGSGAAGWFQIEGNSVGSESGFISKDIPKYQSMLDASGMNVNNYPGMSTGLAIERSMGYTQWYWDCEYYPSAIVNFCANINERRDKVASSDWLVNNEVYKSFTDEQKNLACYYVALTLHNNGTGHIKTTYPSSPIFFNYLRAFVDIMTNRYDDFVNQKFGDTSGNAKSSAVDWVINNTTVLSDSEKAELFNNMERKWGSGYKWFGRYCRYSTNAIYNAISKNSSLSALNSLEKAGIKIESGWFNSNGSSAASSISQGNTNTSSTTTNNTSSADNSSANNGNSTTNAANTGNSNTSNSTNSSNTSNTNTSNSNNTNSTNTSNTSTSVGNTGSTGISKSSSGTLGKLVSQDDNVPIYDGFTMNGDKYGYFDRVYKQFWDGTIPQDNPLYGLGDFNLDINVKSTVDETTGSSIGNRYGLSKSGSSRVMQLVDGRVPMAVPAAMVLEDSNFEIYKSLSSDPNNYSPRKKDPPAFNKEGKAKFTTEATVGLYIDIVLDNGTVIPAIVTDCKASHLGSHGHKWYKNNWWYDIESTGWCQLTYNNTGVGPSGGKGSNITQMMMFEPWWGATSFRNKLKGHKVVGTRTYKVQLGSKTGWKEHFQGGGTDSSFGLTGGSTTGTATLDGSSVSGTGNNSNISTHINCTCKPGCSCGCPCSKGGNNSGTTVGETKIGLSETPGLPQGLYCDASGKQLTPEEVAEMYKTAPNLYESLKDTIGIAPKFSTPELWTGIPDNFKDKFGDGVGVLQYCQFANSDPYWSKNYVYGGHGNERIVSGATFASSSCGFCDLSIIVSTMLHRYITPPEIIMTSYVSPQLSVTATKNQRVFSGNVLYSKNVSAVLDCFRFKGKQLFNVSTEGFSQSKVDETLNAGGMVMFVTKSPLWTGGSHYVVIRYKDSEGNYYTVDSGNWVNGSREGRPSRKNTFNDILRGKKPDQDIFVTPGEGYADYLAYYSSTNSSAGASGDTDENSTDINIAGANQGSGAPVTDLDSGVSALGKTLLDRDIQNVRDCGGLTNITSEAIKYIGCPYVSGGNSLENGSDCSGFVREIYKKFGVSLPRTSSQQSKAGRAVNESELKPGDLIFYGDSGVSHVVMYLGNGKIIHSSNSKSYTSGGGVKTGNNIHYRNIVAIRRYIE